MSSIFVHQSISSGLRNALAFSDSVKDLENIDPATLDSSSIVILDYLDLASDPQSKVDGILAQGIHPFVVADKMTDEIHALLTRKGIARFADCETMIRNARYLFCNTDSEKNGKVLLVDGDEISNHALGSIAGLFGYSLERVSTLEDCIARIAFSPDMVLHNLAYSGIDRYQFTKRMSYSNLTQIPYIAFKSDGTRISLEDIQCGIQRFTRMILSLEETYSVLAMNLFRKEFFSRMAKMNETADYSAHAIFGSESLKKIFFAHQDLFFESSLPFVEKLLDESDTVLLPAKSLAKMACLGWLVKGKDGAKDLAL